MRTFHLIAAAVSLAAAAGFAQAASVQIVTVNTSALSGAQGSIDFQFNPGLSAQSATAQILGFTGAAYIAASQQLLGGASGGPVPSALSLANSSPNNEVFENVIFGNTLSFSVLFNGPALTSPNGLAGNESTFAFSIFSDLAGTVPALGGDPGTGNVGTITITPEGLLQNRTFSANAQITGVPEPATTWLLCGGLLALLRGRRKHR